MITLLPICQLLSEGYYLLKKRFVYFIKRENGGESKREGERESRANSLMRVDPAWAQSQDPRMT